MDIFFFEICALEHHDHNHKHKHHHHNNDHYGGHVHIVKVNSNKGNFFDEKSMTGDLKHENFDKNFSAPRKVFVFFCIFFVGRGQVETTITINITSRTRNMLGLGASFLLIGGLYLWKAKQQTPNYEQLLDA